MNKNVKTFLIVIASIIIGGAAFAYGALTAPNQPQTQVSQQQTESPKPETSKETKQPETEKPKELSPEEQLAVEQGAVDGVLIEKYPKISSDYTINKGQLFEKGKWYGTTLTYKGGDVNNRDTLRVLMEKKDGTWTLRTTPPRPLLSSKEFPDVPKSVLQAINKPISLPAGAANSPPINPAL